MVSVHGGVALTAWSYGFAGLVFTVLALRLVQLGYLRPSREPSKTAALAAIAFSALWGCSGLLFVAAAQAPFYLVTMLADLLRYGCWFAFLLILLRPHRGQRAAVAMAGMAPVAAIVLFLWLGSLVLAAMHLSTFGNPQRWVLFSAMAASVYSMILLEQVFRNVEEDARWNIKPLCLGLAGTFLFDVYLFSQSVLFNRLDDDALSIRGMVHGAMAPLLLLSMSRRSDWASSIRMSPRAAFHTAALLSAGLYLIFISAVGYYVRFFGGEWGRALQIGLVFLALLVLTVLTLSGAVRARFRVFLAKHFFRYRYDYREEWLKFTRTLSANSAPQQMGLQVVRGLADMLESPAGALWLKTMGDTRFYQTARWNLAPTAQAEDANSSMCRHMQATGSVINLEEYRSYCQRYGQLELPAWLNQIGQAWLVVPLLVGNELIGFCVLASARAPVDVNWEVADLLKTAGQQAASFLTQMQATEALLEVRKFDAFNRMSAFVVHDLKNVVTQLTLMMKNAKRLGSNPEFQSDMLATVENSLDKMRQLMLQLRDGGTPAGATFGVNLADVIQRIRGAAATRGRTLEVQLAPAVLARGHEDRLERIIGHIVQNAFDATPACGRVWLHLDRTAGQARIRVGDTGQGMSPEFIRERLFKPFQSTKQAGMGIGAYESFQYVQDLGGRIEVESEPGHGTTVSMFLPLFESKTRSDLYALECA